jgi:xanthine/uracil permease
MWALAPTVSPCRTRSFRDSSSAVAAIIGFCLMAFVSAVETVGDVSGITKGGAGAKRPTRRSRARPSPTVSARRSPAFRRPAQHLVQPECRPDRDDRRDEPPCGDHRRDVPDRLRLVPKVGAVIRTVPIEVLGGGVIVMFGMVVAAGVSMLSDVNWNRRNMVIFAIALSIGLGLQLEPNAVQYLPDTLKVLATSGMLPAALIAIVLNLVLPEDLGRERIERPQRRRSCSLMSS